MLSPWLDGCQCAALAPAGARWRSCPPAWSSTALCEALSDRPPTQPTRLRRKSSSRLKESDVSAAILTLIFK